MNSQSQKRKNSSQNDSNESISKKKPVDKKSKIDNFSKNIMLLVNFAEIDTVKLKKPGN